MFRLVGCPLKTCTPVESPNTLYMLSRAVTEILSASCESIFSRNRLVYMMPLSAEYACWYVAGSSMPKSCCCSSGGICPTAALSWLNDRFCVKYW